MTKKNNETQVMSSPPAEVEINVELVQQLLQSQYPTLSHLPLSLFDSGWDNDMYRLGTKYAVRLPRRKAALQLLQNEQKWLPILSKRLPIATPSPIYIGNPEFEYPWTWSILPWIEGQAADKVVPAANQVIPLMDFLKALHVSAPVDAPINPHRGIALQLRAERIELRMARLKVKTNLITPGIEQTWEAALQADKATKTCWIHGDLHARNVVVHLGKITGIIDWGDMTSGDVATDLAAIWMLFGDATARQKAIAIYQPSSALLARAKGWAVFFGVVLLETGLVDNPRHAEMGKITLERLTADAS